MVFLDVFFVVVVFFLVTAFAVFLDGDFLAVDFLVVFFLAMGYFDDRRPGAVGFTTPGTGGDRERGLTQVDSAS